MQNPDNIYLVLCILVLILVGSNALMYAFVRGSRGMNFDGFRNFGRDVRRPWAKEEDGLKELSKQADKLRSDQESNEGKTGP